MLGSAFVFLNTTFLTRRQHLLKGKSCDCSECPPPHVLIGLMATPQCAEPGSLCSCEHPGVRQISVSSPTQFKNAREDLTLSPSNKCIGGDLEFCGESLIFLSLQTTAESFSVLCVCMRMPSLDGWGQPRLWVRGARAWCSSAPGRGVG